jgi:hypothetical protein
MIEPTADIRSSKLSQEEARMLRLFRLLSPADQETVLLIAKQLVEREQKRKSAKV